MTTVTPPELTVQATISTTFRAEVMLVTPKVAKAILDRQNTHNRNLSDRTVADYMRDMLTDNWPLNGEAAKFAYDGTCLDGQHRFAAVSLSGVSVPMLIVTGLPLKVQETMDTGKRRSMADVLTLRGESSTHSLAAIVKRVWMWEGGNYKFHGAGKPTVAECTELLQRKPELRRSAEISARVGRSFRYLPPAPVGLAHHLFSTISPEEAPEFFARLGDGASLPIHHPILTLRTRAMKDVAGGFRIPEPRAMAYLIRTWNAVREGRSMSRIIHDHEDAMPMPR
ncbi:hypothetical protein B4N89_27365 [Embleya scabrispora]|uniref:Uncharacterized protein n=1 Tax=Embleya scabrispora TaxID=159449 RepID=A0A1T3P4X8_9ACTN|nr:hypothetical protein [Embleya scabrispora]OPC84149.1 hypothetical protein B4N89_27365 [Embleya scabrispora]